VDGTHTCDRFARPAVIPDVTSDTVRLRYRQLDDARESDLARDLQVARSTLDSIWKTDFKMDMSSSTRRQGEDAH
jgi:hypothetical protein